MCEPAMVLALVMAPGEDPDSTFLEVDRMDPETVTIQLPDGTLLVVEAAELERALSPGRWQHRDAA